MASQQQIGSYAFIAGVAIAIIVGLLVAGGQQSLIPSGIAEYIPIVLIILGVIVGFLNIKDKEVDKFLISAIALIVLAGTAGGLAQIQIVGPYLAAIVFNVAVFVAPAALIVALKAIKGMASTQVNTM